MAEKEAGPVIYRPALFSAESGSLKIVNNSFNKTQGVLKNFGGFIKRCLCLFHSVLDKEWP